MNQRAFVFGQRTKEGRFGTSFVFERNEDDTAAASTHYLLLGVDLIYILRGSTEHRTDAHIGITRVGVVRSKVLAELRAEVVGNTHHGTKVGETALTGITQLSQLLSPHPER